MSLSSPSDCRIILFTMIPDGQIDASQSGRKRDESGTLVSTRNLTNQPDAHVTTVHAGQGDVGHLPSRPYIADGIPPKAGLVSAITGNMEQDVVPAVIGALPEPTTDAPDCIIHRRKRYKQELKLSVLQFLKEKNKEMTYEDVAKRFDVSAGALRDWRRQWEKDGLLPLEEENAEDSTSERKKFKRKRYNTDLKIKVLEFSRAHKSFFNYEEVAKRFDVSVSALRDWRKNEQEILKSVAEKRGNMKANPKYALKRLSDAVMEYWEQNNRLSPDQQVPISMAAIQRKSLEIRESFLEQQSKDPSFMEAAELEAVKAFKASNTWAARLMKRIKSESPKTFDQLHELISQYNPEHVYCMDQTLLFTKILPNRNGRYGGYTSRLPNLSHIKPQDRLTIYLCTNEVGSHKLPPTLLGNSKNPWSFPEPYGKSMLPYIHTKDGLSNRASLMQWWEKVFLPHIRETTSNPVVLIMTTPDGHGLEDKKGQARVEVLPDNFSITHQPVAQGISAALKMQYRYRLLNAIFGTFHDRATRRKIAHLAKLPEGMRGLKEGQYPHFVDVNVLIGISWDSMSEELIQQCWRETDLREAVLNKTKNERKLTLAALRKLEPKTDALLGEVLSSIKAAQQSGDLLTSEGADASYEVNVMGALELAIDDRGRIRDNSYLTEDMDCWCQLEESPPIRKYMEDSHRMQSLDFDTPQPREVGGSDETLDDQNAVNQEQEARYIGSQEIEDCATNILTIAAQLMKAQPQYHAVASQLMDIPDKLLKAIKPANSMGLRVKPSTPEMADIAEC